MILMHVVAARTLIFWLMWLWESHQLYTNWLRDQAGVTRTIPDPHVGLPKIASEI